MKNSTYGICVYGGSSNQVLPYFLDAAYELGCQIGKHGWRLVYGAGDTGMMGQAARGCEAEGGVVTGIAPAFFDRPGVLYKGGQDVIATRTMRERKAFMESLSNAFVVSPGGIGTLEEFYEILTLKQLGQLEAPLVLLNIGGYYDSLLKMMEEMNKERFISDHTMTIFHVATSVDECVAWLEEQFKKPAETEEEEPELVSFK